MNQQINVQLPHNTSSDVLFSAVLSDSDRLSDNDHSEIFDFDNLLDANETRKVSHDLVGRLEQEICAENVTNFSYELIGAETGK